MITVNLESDYRPKPFSEGRKAFIGGLKLSSCPYAGDVKYKYRGSLYEDFSEKWTKGWEYERMLRAELKRAQLEINLT